MTKTKPIMLNNHIRIALRVLRKQKVYTTTTLTGLSLGFASCLLILLFVFDELSYDRYHANKDRIFRMATQIQGSTFEGIAKVNGPWGPAAKDEIPEIEAMTRFVMAGQQLVRRNNERFYETNGLYADSTVSAIFSYRWLKGNANKALTEPGSIVLTRSLAEKYFGDGDGLGETIRIENEDFKVTGILEDIPSNSHFTFGYLLSMSSLRHPQRDHWVQWNQFYTYVLLRKNVSPEVVAAKMKGILEKNLDAEVAANYTPFLQPLTRIHLHSQLHREMTPNSNINYIYIFSSIALLILGISCANFINMATAQAASRAKEIGVRKVSGAIRQQLVLQFLTEAFVICLCSLVIALVLTIVALPSLNDLTGKDLSLDQFDDLRIVLSMSGIVLSTALLAGSYPSFYQAGLKPISVLKGKWSPAGNAGLRKSLVVFQFALSSMLVVAIVIILQQLHFIQNKTLGFDPAQVITIPIQDDRFRMDYEMVKHELTKHPGVLSVSLSGNLPGGSDWGIPSIPEGFTSENAPSMRVMVVDHSFIKTYGFELAAGRDFSEALASDSGTYLINEEAVRQLGWKDPLSKTISMPAAGRPAGAVVGVVKDFHFRSMHEKIGPILFLIPPRGWYSIYSIKIDGRQTADALKFIEERWGTLDPVHPFTYNFFDEFYQSLHRQETRLARIVGYFTMIGIFLACLGLYSLASYTTQQRRKEIGIRKVVGATSGQIVVLLSRQYLILVLAGFIISLPLALWVLKQWLQSFEYHVDFNLVIISACGVLSMAVALLTVGFRSLKAAAQNPVDSLRTE
jgi:putative ABC transport system permease protein